MELVNTTIHREYPVMQARNAKGLLKFWQIRVLIDSEGRTFLQSEDWQETKDGGESKHKVSTPAAVTPKNIGRSNETTPTEQACFQAESTINKKMDKGYWLVGEPEPYRRPLPMAAARMRDHADKVVFPCMVQRKEDGSRMLYDGKEGWTRQNKTLPDEVISHLHFDTKGLILDGELTKPLDVMHLPFEERKTARVAMFQYVQSISRKVCPENRELHYLVYDVVDAEAKMTYAERRRLLEALDLPPQVSLIEEIQCEDFDDIDAFYEDCLEQGLEGAMVRNLHGVYRINDYRSRDLLKVKPQEDEEYPIVAVEAGTGKDAERPIFVVDLGNGNTARARLMGSQEYAAEVWARRHTLIGTMVTIEHEGETPDGSLRFPKAKALREE